MRGTKSLKRALRRWIGDLSAADARLLRGPPAQSVARRAAGSPLLRRDLSADLAAAREARARRCHVEARRALRSRRRRRDPRRVLSLGGRTRPRPRWCGCTAGAGFPVTSDKSRTTRVLASHGYTVVSINYSLAPGCTYPKPVRQIVKALGYLEQNARRLHVDASRFFLAGDSAGAQLCAQVANVVTSPRYAAELGLDSPISTGEVAGGALVLRSVRRRQPRPGR